MGGWYFGHKVIDSTEMESRFSNEDSMAFLDTVVQDTVSEEGAQQLERVRAIMCQLPPREADFIDLYYFKRVKQTDIALVFGVSQPTVCYRLQRAAARIRFMLTIPEVTTEGLREALTGIIPDPVDVTVMARMLETTCQSEVAKGLGVTQGFVRHRFLRTLEKMRNHEHLLPYVDTFDRISANLNILREVQRPSWDARVYVVA